MLELVREAARPAGTQGKAGRLQAEGVGLVAASEPQFPHRERGRSKADLTPPGLNGRVCWGHSSPSARPRGRPKAPGDPGKWL